MTILITIDRNHLVGTETVYNLGHCLELQLSLIRLNLKEPHIRKLVD